MALRLQLPDIKSFSVYNIGTSVSMGKLNKPEKSPLTHKLIAAWLKFDPFIQIIAKDNQAIRHDAMLALVGKKAAKQFFNRVNKLKPPPSLVFPHHVREKEKEFLAHPKRRSKIIRQLVYWGRDAYLNSENSDSYNTRIQIVHTMLGPLFLNSSEVQEKLIVDGLKVLVISKQTSTGKTGEQSHLVHKEIIDRTINLIRYNHFVKKGKQDQRTEEKMRAHLIKTIQSFKQNSYRSAYYVADDQKNRKKRIAQRFPLRETTESGLLEIIKHYSLSAWPEFRRMSEATLNEVE